MKTLKPTKNNTLGLTGLTSKDLPKDIFAREVLCQEEVKELTGDVEETKINEWTKALESENKPWLKE